MRYSDDWQWAHRAAAASAAAAPSIHPSWIQHEEQEVDQWILQYGVDAVHHTYTGLQVIRQLALLMMRPFSGPRCTWSGVRQ